MIVDVCFLLKYLSLIRFDNVYLLNWSAVFVICLATLLKLCPRRSRRIVSHELVAHIESWLLRFKPKGFSFKTLLSDKSIAGNKGQIFRYLLHPLPIYSAVTALRRCTSGGSRGARASFPSFKHLSKSGREFRYTIC